MAGISDAKEFAVGFIAVFIGVLVAVSILPLLLSAVDNLTGVPILSATIVGTVAGAGILLFLMKAFF